MHGLCLAIGKCFWVKTVQKKPVFLAAWLAIFFLLLAAQFSSGMISITVTVLDSAPVVSDENVSPANWAGSGSLILGFKCTDPNGIADFNAGHAAIRGANNADLNYLSFAISGNNAIFAESIAAYITTRGNYKVTVFCADDSNNVGKSSIIDANYVYPAAITVYTPVQDENIGSSLAVSFDLNKNGANDVNIDSIAVDLNGSPSLDFNSALHCTEFGGEYHCAYTETGLPQDADSNVSFNAMDEGGGAAVQVERIVHYDATAPVILSFSASSSGSDVALSWAGSDGFTGIETYYARADSGSWIDAGLVAGYTFSGHQSASHTYYVKARDFADNNSLISSASYSAPVPPSETPGGGPGGGGGGGGGLPPVTGEELFDIRIVRVDDPVGVGEKFDFTYVVSNNTRKAGSAYIEYWLELGGEKAVSGSETVYLKSGEERELDSMLILLQDMDGEYLFHLKLSKEGQLPVERERTSRIMLEAPVVIDLNISSLEPGDETQPVSFEILVGSNKDESLPVLIEEKIFRGGELIWSKKQTVPIRVFKHFFEEIYGLEPGIYTLQVTASYGRQEKIVAESFEKKARPAAIEAGDWQFFFWILPWILLVLLAILLLYAAKRLALGKRVRRRRRQGL